MSDPIKIKPKPVENIIGSFFIASDVIGPYRNKNVQNPTLRNESQYVPLLL